MKSAGKNRWVKPLVELLEYRCWLSPPLAAALLSIALLAHHGAAVADEETASWYDNTWRYATLFENQQSKGLQKFAISGRLQLDAAYLDADQGEFDDLRWRRFRFGFTTHFLGTFSMRVEGDFDLNQSGKYRRLTDSYIGWSPTANTEIRVLKHSAGFTLDGATSSTKLLTPQRNNLTNNLWFTVEYFTGLSIKGKAARRWKYKAGVFSSNGDDELGSFNAGYFGLLSLAYDFAPASDFSTAKLRIDYVKTSDHPDAATRDMKQVISLAGEWQRQRWGLRTDLSAGQGQSGHSDLWGLVGMPFYQINPRMQAVFRYTWIKSEDPNGVRFGRYESEIVGARGDKYIEYFAGFNLFFYGHKFKWQSGLEYASMKDKASDGGVYEGWGLSTVLRTYW